MRSQAKIWLAATPLLALGVAASPASSLAVTGTQQGGAAGLANQSVTGSAEQPVVATVTLVTGDKVRVHGSAGGTQYAVIASVDRDPAGYLIQRVDDDLIVVPGSAASLVQAGRLDQRLFNVTSLIEQGYADEATDHLPLIAQYDSAATASPAVAAAPPGTERIALLESIGGVALAADKGVLRDFWREFADAGPTASQVPARLWLDGKVRASLDRSVEQVGAPAAWQQGYDGSGVKVAVLDGGYDPAHPDLLGRVITEANFTDRLDAVDEDGHGTHVASTLAGSGKASSGDRTGVAPGADLLIGRVLGPWGGMESWIIDGMEWAVAQGADVINMSLGSWEPSDCTDPLSQAAQRITENDAALLVVAAGNTGHRQGITSPGCAPGVLTVGAVDRAGATASFSARGPVLGSHLVKPDLAAPGVGIMAAALGSPGDNHYRALSGTSMATPHVAGAAAILAQQHPTAGPADLKAMLVSAARPDAPDGPYDQGAGLLDIARATSQTVFGPGTLDLGSFNWPLDTAAPRTQTVTYRNLGTQPVTLDINIDVTNHDGAPVPRGLVSLSAHRVTVPAKGTAEIGVTVDPRVRIKPEALGEFSGRLVASGADGTAVISPASLWLEPEMVDLTIKMLDRRGHAANGLGFLDVYHLGTDSGWRIFPTGEEQHTLRVRPGTYSIVSVIPTYDADAASPWDSLTESLTYVGHPEVKITRDTMLVLDARRGRQTTVDAERPVEHRGGLLSYARWTDRRVDGAVVFDEYVDELYVVPDRAQVRTGHFEFGTYLRMYAPSHSLRAADLQLAAEDVEWGTALDGRGTAPVADAGRGSQTELGAADVRGKFALVDVPDPWEEPLRILEILRAAESEGALGVLISRAAPGRWQWSVGHLIYTADGNTGAPGFTISSAEATALRARLGQGEVSMSWSAQANSPYVYNLALVDRGRAGANQHHVIRDRDLGHLSETWYAPGQPSRNYGDFLGVFRPGDSLGLVVAPIQRVHVPQQRVQHFTAGDTRWLVATSAQPTWGADVFDRLRSYSPGEHLTTSWWHHPMQTGVQLDLAGTPQRMGERQGNLMGFHFPHWQDADPDHHGPRAGFGDLGRLELYRDGRKIGEAPEATGQFEVPGDAGTYELRVLTDRAYAGGETYPEWRMSLSTLTTFRFWSARPDGENVDALPLLLPDYDVALDLFSTAPAEQGFPVRLSFSGQADYDHRGIESVRFWVSADDGETWDEAPVARLGDSWVAHVDNRAAAGGYVTTKVEATDANGNSVEQIVKRAFGVRS